MGSSGFSSPRSECFPAGLRVLVVDDDPTWLKILEKMLKKCNYEVTTCSLAREALNLLRERKDGFDIVISDVNMPDMDGFKLLEYVGIEMDLPVIMMSVDGETSRVMKGVQHGACDYLLKPIRMKELKNIWQHVFRKRIHEVRDIEGLEEIHMLGNGTEQSDDGFLFSGDLISGRKRKGDDSKSDDTACSDPSSLKKTRVVWTVDLHQKFVRAVNHIGFDKVGPKKILDLMGISWLSRENVASHLQKYRLYLSRLQKENEAKVASGGIKNADYSPKGTSTNISIQKVSLTENFPASGHKIPIIEGISKGTLPIPLTESKKSLFDDAVDPPKSSISFGFTDSDVKSEPKFQAQFSWNAGSSSVQFKPERNRHFQPGQSFGPLHHVHVDSMQPSQHYSKEPDKPITVSKNQTRSTGKVTKVESTAALFSFQPQTRSTQFEPIQQQNLFHGLEYSSGNNATGSTFKLRDEEFSSFSSQSYDFHLPNIDFASAVSFGGFDQELVANIPLHVFDSVNFDYPNESVEYQALDQGLFIA